MMLHKLFGMKKTKAGPVTSGLLVAAVGGLLALTVTRAAAGTMYVTNIDTNIISRANLDGTVGTSYGIALDLSGPPNPTSITPSSGVSTGAVNVTNPAPTVTGITPNSGTNNGTVNITNLAGTGFLTGATVKLTKTGQTDISATSVAVVSSTKITCALDLTGAPTGTWNVIVTNTDTQSGTLANGFTVLPPPSLQFTSVPAYGSTDNLQGSTNADPNAYKVAVYIFVPCQGGWWTKPTKASPLTPINPDGTWSCNIVTGGLDTLATQIAAYLLPVGYTPPDVLGLNNIPDEIEQHALAKTTATRTPPVREISFSGYQWTVKSGGSCKVGQGTNFFSDSPDDVWVDAQGRLHVKITNRNGVWNCAEVIGKQTLGFGIYRSFLDTSVDNLDPNVVFSPFVWSDNAPFNHREIDIEFGRWGDASDPNNAQYVVQPSTPDNVKRFKVPAGPTKHSFSWASNYVFFQSKTASDTVINEWTYTGTVPPSLDEKPHINLWLLNGQPPINNSEVEIVVSKFEFIPLGSNSAPTVTGITPNSGVNSGPINITNLAGTGFLAGATVKLTQSSQPDLYATNVTVVSPSKITCTFDLTGKATGQWNVVVTDQDGQAGSLSNGFTITASPPPPTHDVALTNFSASPNPVSRGSTVSFSVTVKNLGTYTENGVTFTMSYGTMRLAGPIKLSNWKAGQEMSGVLKLVVPRNIAPGDYLITGQLSTVAGETNTANNSQTVKLTVK